jgi:hypothetical protein
MFKSISKVDKEVILIRALEGLSKKKKKKLTCVKLKLEGMKLIMG